jgi:ankyrin repeat protein
LLDKGADIHAQGGEYGNALQAASDRGYAEIVRLLLNKGAQINAQGGEHSNALQAASTGGHTEIVRLLLDQGADVNAQGSYYGNALQAASCCGHVEVVRLLLGEGADVNAQGGKHGNAFFAAIAGKHDDLSFLLLDHGFSYNKVQQDSLGRSRLLLAACCGYLSGLEQDLMSRSASVHEADNHQWTALHWAAYFGQTASINLLLRYGADLTKRDWRGWNPYDIGVFVGHDIPALRVEGADTPSAVPVGMRIRGECDVCGHVSGYLLRHGLGSKADLTQELVQHQHHCRTCESGYDLCFRCFRDVEVVHAGHEFATDFRYW